MPDQAAIESELRQRSGDTCELCGANSATSVYPVPPLEPGQSTASNSLLTCQACLPQIEGGVLDPKHWYGLKDSIWSEIPAVQVVGYRLLTRLSAESWAQDLLSQVYLDDATLEWANADSNTATADDGEDGDDPVTVDSNGLPLLDGDSVSLIRNLDVKGANFTAKRGTVVKGISLTDNPEHVEGRVNRMTIVLKTCFLKKI